MPILKPGICSSASYDVIHALRTVGVKTVEDFICCNVEEVSSTAKITFTDMVSIRKVLLVQYGAVPITGSKLFKQTLDYASILSTGTAVLDRILDGGLYATEVTELAGPIAVGKTQICFCSAASVATMTQQHVLFLDTCGSFSAERIEEIIIAKDMKDINKEECLERIRCTKVFDIYELLSALDRLRYDITTHTDAFYTRLKLVIVDSLPAVVSPILGGQQTQGLSLLAQLGITLKKLAVDFTLAVLVTNNVVSSGSGGTKVAMGRQWQHTPHTRVLVGREEGHYTATLAKSSRLSTALQKEHFTITDCGPTVLPS